MDEWPYDIAFAPDSCRVPLAASGPRGARQPGSCRPFGPPFGSVGRLARLLLCRPTRSSERKLLARPAATAGLAAGPAAHAERAALDQARRTEARSLPEPMAGRTNVWDRLYDPATYTGVYAERFRDGPGINQDARDKP